MGGWGNRRVPSSIIGHTLTVNTRMASFTGGVPRSRGDPLSIYRGRVRVAERVRVRVRVRVSDCVAVPQVTWDKGREIALKNLKGQLSPFTSPKTHVDKSPLTITGSRDLTISGFCG